MAEFIPPAPFEGEMHSAYLLRMSQAFAEWVNSRPPLTFDLCSHLVRSAADNGLGLRVTLDATGTLFIATPGAGQ